MTLAPSDNLLVYVVDSRVFGLGGKDETIFCNRIGERFIRVGDQTYRIVEELFIAGPSDARATVVYRCLDASGATVVVKDCWIQRILVDKEPRFMERVKAAGMSTGVLQMKECWRAPDCAVRCKEDSTRRFAVDFRTGELRTRGYWGTSACIGG